MSLLQVIEIGAVTASAVYGILMATRKEMDFVGLFTVGSIVAFGGGTLRDLFLDRQPLFWIANPQYPMLVFGLAFIGACLPSTLEKVEKFIALPDAIGLGLYTIVGLEMAIAANCHPFVAILIGVITGTFGGVIAEVICNEVPSLFRPAPLCATCSFAGAVVAIVLSRWNVDPTWTAILGASVVVVFRLTALRYQFRLPTSNV